MADCRDSLPNVPQRFGNVFGDESKITGFVEYRPNVVSLKRIIHNISGHSGLLDRFDNLRLDNFRFFDRLRKISQVGQNLVNSPQKVTGKRMFAFGQNPTNPLFVQKPFRAVGAVYRALLFFVTSGNPENPGTKL